MAERAERVRVAQAAARDGLVLGAAFAAAALVAAAGGERWLALHLFLAGGVVSIIGGATVLFAATWSAGAAPGPRATRLQLALTATGATGVAVARTAEAPDGWLLASAAAFAAGLALLGVLVVGTVRSGTQRRFDVTAAWYVAALAAGLAAAGLGTALATGHGPAGARGAHVACNLLGLVGLVIGGTVPTFAATTGRTKAAPAATPGRRVALLAWQGGAVALAAAGALAGARGLEAAALAAYAAGIVGVATLLPRPDRRQLAYAGPRLVGLHLGLAWWAGAVAVAAGRAAAGNEPLAGRVLLVLAVGALAQIVWASAAYLAPVIRAGGHERLAAGFRATRSWTALAAWNAAALLLATGAAAWALAAVAVATVETLARHASLTRRAVAT